MRVRRLPVCCGTALLLLAAACSSGGGSSSSTSAPHTKGADPGSESAGDPSQAAYTPTGQLIADSGFRPEANSFKFQNYGATLASGSAVTNLTPEDVQKVYGDAVCVDAQTGKCDLTPEAQSWMDQANAGMGGGHCEGFSMASLLAWAGKRDANTLGAASVPELAIDGNTALQREIATDFMFQSLPSVLAGQIHGTPNDILAKLKDVLKPNPDEAYTLGIYKADHSGGHAVTPYAIEDKGNGIENVLIYDNNYPGVTREVTVDTNANKWSYDAATNPSEPTELYVGDASTNTMELDPAFPGLGTQPWPYAGKVTATSGDAGAMGSTPAGAKLVSFRAGAAAPMDQIWLDGSDTDHGHLLITDPSGHRLGLVNGKIVNEIPGSSVQVQKSDRDWLETTEPDYFVPDGVKYTITVDGTSLQSQDDTSVGVIAPGFEAEVHDIKLDPGQKDTFTVAPDASEVSYTSSRGESPTLEVGVSDDTADYTFTLTGVSDQPGGTVRLLLPPEGTDFTIDTGAGGGTAKVALTMLRQSDQGDQTFKHDGIELSGGDTATLKFSNWSDGQPLPLVVKHAGNETTQTLVDNP